MAILRPPLSADIISHCVWLCFRFCLSYGEVQEMMVELGLDVSHEAILVWCEKFGRQYASQLRKQRGRLGDQWHLDGSCPMARCYELEGELPKARVAYQLGVSSGLQSAALLPDLGRPHLVGAADRS